MIKIYDDRARSFGNKINFIDNNGVLVGFDFDQHCCESFGWFVSDSIVETREKQAEFQEGNAEHYEPGLEDYRFDHDFFKNINDIQDDEGGGTVVFRLLSAVDGNNPKYLHLYNHHNGYYQHGFNFSTPSEQGLSGSI
jgi:hypothetical protein